MKSNPPDYSDVFYRALIDRRQGSRAQVLEQLQAYLPFLAPFAALTKKGRAVDLASDRAEWLQILRDQGFDAQGVDSDPSHIAAAQMYGLSIDQADPLQYLKDLSSQSICVISAFHLVDQLSIDQLRNLVGDALRVLMPGGILILGAANPEYAALSVSNPSLPHSISAVTPALLEYVIHYEGFERHLIARSLGPSSFNKSSDLELRDMIACANPCYAVIAQKQGPADLIEAFEAAFNSQYGLSMQELIVRYLSQQDERLAQATKRFSELDSKIVGEAERINLAMAALDSRIHAAEASIHAAEASLASVNAKLSSIRYFIYLMAYVQGAMVSGYRLLVRSRSLARKIAMQLRFRSIQLLKHLGLYSVTKRMYRYLIPNKSIPDSQVNSSIASANDDRILSARARQIAQKISEDLKKVGK